MLREDHFINSLSKFILNKVVYKKENMISV